MGTSKKLRKVYLSADVYALCLQHALSTEKEEVMGLLIGDVTIVLYYYKTFLIYFDLTGR